MKAKFRLTVWWTFKSSQSWDIHRRIMWLGRGCRALRDQSASVWGQIGDRLAIISVGYVYDSRQVYEWFETGRQPLCDYSATSRQLKAVSELFATATTFQTEVATQSPTSPWSPYEYQKPIYDHHNHHHHHHTITIFIIMITAITTTLVFGAIGDNQPFKFRSGRDLEPETSQHLKVPSHQHTQRRQIHMCFLPSPCGFQSFRETFSDLVPLLQHGLTLIPAWISKYTHYVVWDEITYPFRKSQWRNRWSLEMDK